MNSFETLRKSLIWNGKPVSQRKLSKEIGIAASHISELETGRTPSTCELKAYHLFFRVSYEYLLGETDEYISSDTFREKPLVETRVQNTLRWLNESKREDELELREMINILLGEEKGLLLLFYLSNVYHHNKNEKELLYCLKHMNSNEYDKFTYADLRLLMDNIKKEEH